MESVTTTLLDVLALMLLAAGAVVGVWPVNGGAALATGGVVVGVGSRFAARR